MGETKQRVILVAGAGFETSLRKALASRFVVLGAPAKGVRPRSPMDQTPVSAWIVDAHLPDRAGLALVERLANVDPGLAVILVAHEPTRELVSFAARHIVPLLVAPITASHVAEVLANADRRAIGKVERVLRSSFEDEARQALLTPQERAVTWMSLLGATAKEAAAMRGVNIRTVEAQRYEVMKKLSVPTMDMFRWRLLGRVLPNWRSKG